jgi:hypothetical protein
VFENRVLRRIFGPKREEVTGEWRELYNDELNDLYSPNIVRVIKSGRMRWAGHVVCMGRGEASTGFWWGNLKEKDHLGDPGIVGRNDIKMDIHEVGWGGWTGSSWLRIGTGGGPL